MLCLLSRISLGDIVLLSKEATGCPLTSIRMRKDVTGEAGLHSTLADMICLDSYTILRLSQNLPFLESGPGTICCQSYSRQSSSKPVVQIDVEG